jgi:CRP-like cAMP-binding protein
MDLIAKVFELRTIELFKGLEAEILFMVAEECQHKNFSAGETIFLQNDDGDGLYCISSGEIQILHNEKVIANLKNHDFFGELALIDEGKRTGTAIATTDCSVLFLEKNTFARLTDDLPEVLRVVTRVIVHYLRSNLGHMPEEQNS